MTDTNYITLQRLASEGCVLPKNVLEEYKEAENVMEQISDAVDLRVGFIFNRIVEESRYNITKPKNTYLPRWDRVDPYPPHYLPNSDDFFSSIPMLKNQFFHYATYWFANPPIRFNIILDNGTTIDLFKMFPTSWLYEENFLGELLAGRNRFLDSEKETKKKDAYIEAQKEIARAEQEAERLAAVERVRALCSEKDLEILGLKHD